MKMKTSILATVVAFIMTGTMICIGQQYIVLHTCAIDKQSTGGTSCGTSPEGDCSGGACQWITYTYGCDMAYDMCIETCPRTVIQNTAWCTDPGDGSGCDCE